MILGGGYKTQKEQSQNKNQICTRLNRCMVTKSWHIIIFQFRISFCFLTFLFCLILRAFLVFFILFSFSNFSESSFSYIVFFFFSFHFILFFEMKCAIAEIWHTHAQQQYVKLNNAKYLHFLRVHIKGHETSITFHKK